MKRVYISAIKNCYFEKPSVSFWSPHSFYELQWVPSSLYTCLWQESLFWSKQELGILLKILWTKSLDLFEFLIVGFVLSFSLRMSQTAGRNWAALDFTFGLIKYFWISLSKVCLFHFVWPGLILLKGLIILLFFRYLRYRLIVWYCQEIITGKWFMVRVIWCQAN